MSWLAVQCASSPVEGGSFATDLLLCHEAVRKRVNVSMKSYEEVSVFIKARAEVEEAYAEGLRKVAALPMTMHDDTTMKEAIEALRSNLLNKSVQHSLLSEQLLSSELLEEIKTHQTKAADKQKALTQHLTTHNKEIKSLEDKYRSASRKYAKAWHESCLKCGECLPASPYPSPKTNPRRNSSSSPRRTTSPSPRSSSGASVSPARSKTPPPSSSPLRTTRKSPSPPPPPPLTNNNSSSKSLGGVTKSTKSTTGNIAQWLMPTEEERRAQATHVFEMSTRGLEEARMATSNAWKMLVGAQQRCCLGLQSVLSDIQLCEEEGGSCLRDLIRSNLVHESSLIANMVYDMESSTAPKVNSFDPMLDLSMFIKDTRSKSSIHQATIKQESPLLATSSKPNSIDDDDDDDDENHKNDRDSIESYASACSSIDHRGSDYDIHTVKEVLNRNEEEDDDDDNKNDEVIVDKPLSPITSDDDEGINSVEEKMKCIQGIYHTCGGSSLNVSILTRPGGVMPKPPTSIDRHGLMFPPPCKAVIPTTAQYRAHHRENELIPLPSIHPWSLLNWHLPVVVSVPLDKAISSDNQENQHNLIPAFKMLNMISSFKATFDFQDSESNQENKISGSGDLDELHHGKGGGGGDSGEGKGNISYLTDGRKVKTMALPVNNHMFFGSLYRKNGVIAPSARPGKGTQQWRSLTGIRVIDTAAESFGNKIATTAYSAFTGAPSSGTSPTSSSSPPTSGAQGSEPSSSVSSSTTASTAPTETGTSPNPSESKWVDVDQNMVEASLPNNGAAEFNDGYKGNPLDE